MGLKTKQDGEVASCLEHYLINHHPLTRSNDLARVILRTDNGTEFTNKMVDSLCRRFNIQREFTVPFESAQSGEVGRAQRSHMNKIRALRSDSNLATAFSLLPVLIFTIICLM